MTRCEAFYRKVKQLVEAKNFEGLEAFCQKDSQVTLWRINSYIEFCDRYSLPMGNVAERALRPLIVEPNAEVQDKVVILLKEKLVVQKVAEKDVIALLNEAKNISEPSKLGIDSESVYKEPRNEIQTENIPLITKTPSSQDMSILSADVQKQVEECIERAKLSEDEAKDLVKVVQQTPKDEIPRIWLTPRAHILMLHAKKPQPKPEAREWKPKEKPEQRVAVMHPQKSAFELSVIQDLQAEGLPIETDREFCVQRTIPDGYVSSKNAVIYLDGPVHEGKEERDEQLRERLEKFYNCHVIVVKFTSDTKEERERAKTEIREAMKE